MSVVVLIQIKGTRGLGGSESRFYFSDYVLVVNFFIFLTEMFIFLCFYI